MQVLARPLSWTAQSFDFPIILITSEKYIKGLIRSRRRLDRHCGLKFLLPQTGLPSPGLPILQQVLRLCKDFFISLTVD